MRALKSAVPTFLVSQPFFMIGVVGFGIDDEDPPMLREICVMQGHDTS